MIKKTIYALVAVLSLTFFACSDENPSDGFFENISSEVSSSSVVTESSSSQESISSVIEISSSSWAPYSYGELIDNRDGHVYKTIKIGEQTWMAENLNFEYHNIKAFNPAQILPSLCYNSRDSCAKYGRLYSWSTAMDSATIYGKSGQNCGIWSNNKEEFCKKELYNYARGACPENWHIPTESDVNDLLTYSKTSIENQNWMRHYWVYTEKEDDFSDVFSQYGFLWTSQEIDSSRATLLNLIGNEIESIEGLKQSAYFVRCVKDSLPLYHIEHGTMTDERDGQVYKTVKIGDQWWMAENLNYELPKQEFEGFESTLSLCYNNEPDSCAKYGRLYTFAAATDCCPSPRDINSDSYSPHGICPENWHIPSVNEWRILLNVVNGFATDLKSTSGWFDDGNGYDILDFRLLPAGFYRNYEILEDMGFRYEVPEFDDDSKKIEFTSIGQKACYWTPKHSTRGSFYGDTYQLENAYSFCFSNDKKEASFKMEYKIYAYSVRCVRNE